MPGKDRSLPDTNTVIRYLLKDVPEQFAESEPYFEAVRSGQQKALLLESVLVECIYVLTKHYLVPKDEVVDVLSGLLRYKGFINSDKTALLEALALFKAESIDVVDCVLIATARHNNMAVFSFDKKLKKLFEQDARLPSGKES